MSANLLQSTIPLFRWPMLWYRQPQNKQDIVYKGLTMSQSWVFAHFELIALRICTLQGMYQVLECLSLLVVQHARASSSWVFSKWDSGRKTKCFLATLPVSALSCDLAGMAITVNEHWHSWPYDRCLRCCHQYFTDSDCRALSCALSVECCRRRLANRFRFAFTGSLFVTAETVATGRDPNIPKKNDCLGRFQSRLTNYYVYPRRTLIEKCEAVLGWYKRHSKPSMQLAADVES